MRSRRDLPASWYAQGMGRRRLRGDHDEGTHAWPDRPAQRVQVVTRPCSRCGDATTWPDLCPVCAGVEAERRALEIPEPAPASAPDVAFPASAVVTLVDTTEVVLHPDEAVERALAAAQGGRWVRILVGRRTFVAGPGAERRGLRAALAQELAELAQLES